MVSVNNSKLISDRFTFEYVAYGARINYPKRHPAAEKRHCVIQLFQKNGKAEVFVTEDDRDIPTAEKKLNFADIAFQLRQAGHFNHPTWISQEDVKWYKHVLLDRKGREVLYRAHIGKRSDWTFRARVTFKREYVIGDYRVRGIGFIEDHSFVIGTGGYFNNRPWILPLSMYPSLLDAKESVRKNYRLNHNRTVIYWPELRERLSARDAILFGEPTSKKPEGVSDVQFLESPITPRSI